jgi:hypothetical protein
MQGTSEWVGTDQAVQTPKTPCLPRCPVCSGPLIELRSTLRCARCYFSLCEGCAGEPAEQGFSAGD